MKGSCGRYLDSLEGAIGCRVSGVGSFFPGHSLTLQKGIAAGSQLLTGQ